MEYVKSDAESIRAYTELALGKRLSDFGIDASSAPMKDGDKGAFGKWFESLYLRISPGNAPCIPDFPEAGVEVKSTKLIRKSDGMYGAGERLKLSSLNYELMKKEGSWDESCAYRKNRLMLLVGHVYEKGVSPLKELIELVALRRFPEEDLAVIRNDWERIKSAVIAGTPLSEGMTDYLGAATAGAGGESGETQKTRALVLKQGYVNAIVRQELYGTDYRVESIMKRKGVVRNGESLEGYVRRLVAPHVGKDAVTLVGEFGLGVKPGAKQYHADVANRFIRALFGLKPTGSEPIVEFEKAEIILKTVRLRRSGVPEQHMMLRPPLEYKEIGKTKWEDSEFREILSRRFLFVVFREDSEGTMTLSGVIFWTMPTDVRETDAKWCWEETVRRIDSGHAGQLPRVSENPVCHVRPMALNKKDTLEAPDGKSYTKKGFWLRNTYIAKILGREGAGDS